MAVRSPSVPDGVMSAFAPPTPAMVMRSRLDRCPLDDPSSPRPMSLRLSFEQGWTMEFTARVLEEYRRFLSLAATASTPMTPSVIVDEAWHVHLLYSRSYWTMCDEVFGRPLHHDPTRAAGRGSSPCRPVPGDVARLCRVVREAALGHLAGQ